MTPKKAKPGWSQVKAELADFDRAGLIGLLQDLYAASKDNQSFLNARFALGDEWFWKSLRNTGWLALASGPAMSSRQSRRPEAISIRLTEARPSLTGTRRATSPSLSSRNRVVALSACPNAGRPT